MQEGDPSISAKRVEERAVLVPHWRDFDLLIPAAAIVNLALFWGLVNLGPLVAVREQILPLLGGFSSFLALCLAAWVFSSLGRHLKESLPGGDRVLYGVAFASLFALTVGHIGVAWNRGMGELWAASSGVVLSLSLLSILLWAGRATLVKVDPTSSHLKPSRRGHISKLNVEAGQLAQVDIPVEDLRPEDLIRLSPGDAIPCDGVVLGGRAEVRERRLSGLFATKFKAKGDSVFAGSILQRGEIDVRVSSAAEDSFITSFRSAVDRNLRGLDDERARTANETSRWTLGLAVFAVIVAVFWGATDRSISSGLLSGGSVLLVAFLVVLLLPLEVALKRGCVEGAFRRGVVFKDFSVAWPVLSALKTFVVHYDSKHEPGQALVRELLILDERVDRDALISVLLSLCGRSDEEIHSAMTEFLRPLIGEPTIHEVNDMRWYDRGGLSGSVMNVEFTIGDEDLLVHRGVQLQASDVIEGKDGATLYIAMDEEVVAAFLLAPRFGDEAKRAIGILRATGIRPVLVSGESAEVVDRAARAISLDLSDSHGGITPQEWKDRMEAFGPAVVLLNDATPSELQSVAPVTFGFFDEFRWDTERFGGTLFGTGLQMPAATLAEVKRIASAFALHRRYAVLLGGILVVGAALRVLSPAAIATTVFVGGAALLYNSLKAGGHTPLVALPRRRSS